MQIIAFLECLTKTVESLVQSVRTAPKDLDFKAFRLAPV